MELAELFSALDKAVSDVKKLREVAEQVGKSSGALVAKAQMQLDSVNAEASKAVGKASNDLENAIANARALQEELQLRTTGFLNDQGNERVRIS